jgi:hypothetical protein
MTAEYIYLLQEREFTKTGENIYKIGRTSKENYTRFNQYTKGSILLFQIICDDSINIERKIIEKFKNEFIHCKHIGNEYFMGHYQLMINLIYKIIIDCMGLKIEPVKCSPYRNLAIDDIQHIVDHRFNDIKMQVRQKLGQSYPLIPSDKVYCEVCERYYYNCKCLCKCSNEKDCLNCEKLKCHEKQVRHLRIHHDARDEHEPNTLNKKIIDLFQDSLSKKIAILSHKGNVYLYELSELQYKNFFDETKEKWYIKARTIRYGTEQDIQCESRTILDHYGTVNIITSLICKYFKF